MSLDKLDLWLQARIGQGGAATDLSRLDGFVAAIVAGPVSMDPRDWICPLLGVAREAFDHGGTVEFAAISAVAVRHNVIANTLSMCSAISLVALARPPWIIASVASISSASAFWVM